MKRLILFLVAISTISGFSQESPINNDRAANTIILDAAGVKNLNIETEMVEERDFETTVFAVGRIEELPEHRAVLSSRIAGRIIELKVFLGDSVKKGDVLARVESRQPGSPPPVIDLISPMDGIVVESHARLGEPVEPNQVVLDISDRTKMWAVAKIPENEAGEIKAGTKARLHIPSLGDMSVEATLSKYGVEADREAGTIDGIFILDNKDGKMQPGMRAEFSIITRKREFVMAVPRTAVQGDPTKRVVFVEDFDLPNAYVKVPVVLGEKNDRYFEVLEGVFPGDEVVTKGSYSLSFSSGGGGPSLKEALDAAHGHEHAEDGSELTEADKKVAAGESSHDHSEDGAGSMGAVDIAIRIWAVIATLLFLVLLQGLLRKRNRKSESSSESSTDV
ncbi:efflux RND transporter periplasmic adaptor subunit [Verrucomicrobiales bacterium BCK34]|nr:efflux RND transporter periplasmic adaptor subunit [Verrucomicrobiales bacterium BCK34]